MEEEVGLEAVALELAAPVRYNLEDELVVEAVAMELVAAAVHNQEHEVVLPVEGEVVAGVAAMDAVSAAAAASRAPEETASGTAPLWARPRWGA